MFLFKHLSRERSSDLVRQGCFWHDFTSARFFAGAANCGFTSAREKGSSSSERAEVLVLRLRCRICWWNQRQSATKSIWAHSHMHINVSTQNFVPCRGHTQQAGRVRSMEQIRLALAQGWSILRDPPETCQSIWPCNWQGEKVHQ